MVLVVEEVATLRDALIAALEAEGWQVLAADEPATLSILEARDVDLVVADPTEGSDTLARVEEAHPDLPLIVLSDAGPEAAVAFGPWERSGSRRTLHRPFKLSDVIAAARDALQETAEPES